MQNRKCKILLTVSPKLLIYVSKPIIFHSNQKDYKLGFSRVRKIEKIIPLWTKQMFEFSEGVTATNAVFQEVEKT